MTAAGKAYFGYHLRSKWKLLLCITVIALALTFLLSVGGQKYAWISTDYDTGIATQRVEYNFTPGTSYSVLLICGCMLPITEFSFFKKRRNLDCVYGLPITRREMGVVHYLTGLICLIVPYTCAYFLNFLLLLRYPEGFCYPPVLGYYFLSLLMGICAYSVNVFVFNQANSKGDGIWFMIFWAFIFLSLSSTWNSITKTYCMDGLNWSDEGYAQAEEIWSQKWEIHHNDMGISWAALSEIQMIYSEVIEKADGATLASFWGDPWHVIWLVFWIVLGIGSVVGFVHTFGKRRTEKTEEVSDSWFGFKVMIPLYAILSVLSSVGSGAIFIMILSFVGYLIYRKGFHLKKSDWIVLAILFVVCILLSIVIVGGIIAALGDKIM